MSDYKLYSYLFEYTEELAESWLKTNMVGLAPVDTLLDVPMIRYMHSPHKIDDLVYHLSEVLEVNLRHPICHQRGLTLNNLIIDLLSQKDPVLYKINKLEKLEW